MRRIKDDFLKQVETVISLKDASVLDIGCGDGQRSLTIAECCKTLTGIDPSEEQVALANDAAAPHASFQVARAEALPFDDHTFDLVLFTLSLHHVPESLMATAIDEALRVAKPRGYIIFFEPGTKGSFFDAERTFNISDGDETPQKAAAYKAILQHKRLRPICELEDQTILQFDSEQDFTESMQPTKNLAKLDDFLKINDYKLQAQRRINIYQPK